MNVPENGVFAIRRPPPNKPPLTKRLPLGLLIAGLLLAGSSAQAIRGGQPAEAGKWTYHVALFNGGAQNCGGVLVAPRFVLTAAHCAGSTVYVGSQELIRAPSGGRLRAGAGQLINVAARHIHPSYDGNRTHDIALLELATAAPASYGAATLPNPAIHNSIASDGVQAVAVGWGTPAPFSSSNPSTWPPTRLQQASLTLKSQDACGQLMGGAFNREAHICTQDVQQGRGICQGDSGSPLFVRSNGIDYQVGIASFAESFYSGVLQCSTSGFTKVATYLDWINERISSASPPPPPPPPPPPANRAPEVVRPIDGMSLLPDASRQIDASAAFRDRDGDRLAYSAQSSDPAVAAATTQEETVTIVAKAPGAATVTLTATDPDGLSAQLVFSVRVKGPPQVTGEIADVSLLPGASEEIDPSAAFADPDGDSMSYEAQSADPLVATAAYLDRRVRISAEAPGLTTITLTATDADGLSASLAIAVTVKGPPTAVGEIAALSLPAGALAGIDAAARFTDPNEDQLTYQASSSNAAVAAVAMDNGVARVVTKAPGTATVTITAVDGDGMNASLSFSVRVAAALPSQELLVGGDVLAMPLSSLFADAGGIMEPAASSSNAALVAAGIADGALILTSVGEDEGAATISVTATGGDDWRKTLRFQAEAAAMRSFLRGWRLEWIKQLAQPDASGL